MAHVVCYTQCCSNWCKHGCCTAPSGTPHTATQSFTLRVARGAARARCSPACAGAGEEGAPQSPAAEPRDALQESTRALEAVLAKIQALKRAAAATAVPMAPAQPEQT